MVLKVNTTQSYQQPPFSSPLSCLFSLFPEFSMVKIPDFLNEWICVYLEETVTQILGYKKAFAFPLPRAFSLENNQILAFNTTHHWSTNYHHYLLYLRVYLRQKSCWLVKLFLGVGFCWIGECTTLYQMTILVPNSHLKILKTHKRLLDRKLGN